MTQISQSHPAQTSSRTAGLLLITIIVMDLLVGMEFDLFVPSFPELQQVFQLSPFWVEGLLSVNFMGLCLSLFLVGELGDRYGRRPIILLGLLTFILGSILCLHAESYAALMVGRFLQGVGVAAPAILSFLIIADAYPLKKQQTYMALLNGIMNTAIAIAPIIGSYVTLYFHWQGNFRALLILGLLTLGMTLLFIPAKQALAPQEATSPGSYAQILRSKPLMLLIVGFVFSFVPYWIFVGMSPLLFMEDLGVPLAEFGYYQGFLALVFAGGSLLSGLLIKHFDHQKMLYGSCILFCVSVMTLLLAGFLECRSPILIILAFLPFVLAQIIPSTILYPVCLNLLPQAKGRVSALIQGGRLILASLALQVAGYAYTGSFQEIALIMACFIIPAAVTLLVLLKQKDLLQNLETPS